MRQALPPSTQDLERRLGDLVFIESLLRPVTLRPDVSGSSVSAGMARRAGIHNDQIHPERYTVMLFMAVQHRLSHISVFGSPLNLETSASLLNTASVM